MVGGKGRTLWLSKPALVDAEGAEISPAAFNRGTEFRANAAPLPEGDEPWHVPSPGHVGIASLSPSLGSGGARQAAPLGY